MPFFKVTGDEPADVVLQQIGASSFRVVEPFRYVDPATGDEYTVPNADEHITDLASVPSILLWFVPRFGRHTLPALLHDQLVDHDLADDRERADRIFRDAMGEQGVRLARRWLMWAAVSIATIVRTSWWYVVPISAWLLGWAAVAFRLTPPFAAWDVWPFNVLVDVPWRWAAFGAAAGPPALGALWTRRYLTGVISGYGTFLFAVPLAAIVIALGVYQAVERLLTAITRDRGGRPSDRSTVEVTNRAEP